MKFQNYRPKEFPCNGPDMLNDMYGELCLKSEKGHNSEIKMAMGGGVMDCAVDNVPRRGKAYAKHYQRRNPSPHHPEGVLSEK